MIFVNIKEMCNIFILNKMKLCDLEMKGSWWVAKL